MRPDTAFKPKTYKDWLNEINFSSKPLEMVHAGNMAGKLAPDKKTAQHDIALVLAEKYRQEMIKAGGNVMVVRGIRDKYQEVSKKLFNINFPVILNYVKKNEPEYNIKKTKEAEGASPPGYIRPIVTEDEKGRPRKPLGFVKKPVKKTEDGDIEPSLGFLADDAPAHGGLGFL